MPGTRCVFCGDRLSFEELSYPKRHQCDEKQDHFNRNT